MNNQLTIDELRAYQAGQLDGPARHRVERLLLENPFYADALEGLEALQRTGASLPKQTAKLRVALNERIHESATERRLYPLWVTTMAASIALVMGVALYLIFTNNATQKPVAQKQAAKPAEPITVQIGDSDSALHKTVQSVAALEAHIAQQQKARERRTELVATVAQPMAALAQPALAQAHSTVHRQPKPIVYDEIIELKPAKTGLDVPSNTDSDLVLNEPKVNLRRIIHPERAFGPNAPEAPEVTFWNDDQSRLARPQSALTNSDGILLSEVRVVGYGMQQKQALIGAVAKIPSGASPRQQSLLPLSHVGSNLIQGTITDQQGVPLPGVSVMVKGTNVGTTTDGAGRFALDSSAVAGLMLQVATLQIASVGYTRQEISLNAMKNTPIQLMEDTQSLSEMVVVGYGRTQPKAETRIEKPVLTKRSLANPTGRFANANLDKKYVFNGIPILLTELNDEQIRAFGEFMGKQASADFNGPLSVQIRTRADGSLKRVSVLEEILVQEVGGRTDRKYKPSPALRAEAERIVREYGNWPKKRQQFLWLTFWRK